MQEHQPRNAFDIPKLFYFQSRNIHTGSRGRLRYIIVPEDGQMNVSVWRQDLCFEIVRDRGEIEGTAQFPVSEEGFEQMLAYLQTEFDAGSR